MADWPEDEPTEAPDQPQGDPWARVCELIAAGTLAPKAIAACGLTRGEFWSRHARDMAFRDAVYQARLLGIEALADEILEIADSRADPRHRTVQIEARKWLLTKLMPKRYGDKVDLNVTSARSVEQMTDAEITARLRALDAADHAAASAAGPDESSTVH